MRRLNLRSWKTAVVMVVAAVGLGVAATASLASGKAGVIKVAIMTDCKGAFAFGYDDDIGGARVVYRSANGISDTTLATLPAGTQLAPGAFYLLGGSAYAGAEPADHSFGTALSSTGGSIGIRSTDGGLLDSVAYGTAANGLGEGQPAPAPPLTTSPGSSAVRLPDGADTSDNAADFSVTASPTPRRPNMPG